MLFRKYLFAQNFGTYNQALDAYSLRQEVIARNIANAQTPNYRPESVRFEEEFSKATTSLHGVKEDDRHISVGASDPSEISSERETEKTSLAERFFTGQAHVNVDHEMSEMAQNMIRFRFVSRQTQDDFRDMNAAIKGTI